MTGRPDLWRACALLTGRSDLWQVRDLMTGRSDLQRACSVMSVVLIEKALSLGATGLGVGLRICVGAGDYGLSMIVTLNSSELAFSSGAYIASPIAGKALKRPGISARSR